MATDDKIRDEKLLINREVAERSTLSSGKINKYEYLIREETLPSNQRRVNTAGWVYIFPFRKRFRKIRTIENQGKKQIKVIEYHAKRIGWI